MGDMQRPPQAPPQGGNPMRGNDPMSANRTGLNPADMAFMAKSGQVRPDMTFGEFMETSFGIRPEDPLQEAVQKMKKNVQNASPMGKMQNMAQGAGPRAPEQGAPPQGAQKPMPQGRKPMVQSGGLEGLIGQM